MEGKWKLTIKYLDGGKGEYDIKSDVIPFNRAIEFNYLDKDKKMATMHIPLKEIKSLGVNEIKG